MKRFFIGMFTLMLGIGYTFGQDMPSTNEVSAANTVVQENDTVAADMDRMPEFPGGQRAMFQYVAMNMQYPENARAMGFEGRTVCSFLIMEDGSVSDVTVEKSSGYRSLDKEAVRLIKGMPNWIPGMVKGKVIPIRITQPVNFRCRHY